MSVVRVAAVQAATTLFDPAGAVKIVEKWTAQAADRGAQLVAFPESFVGGYPKGSDFGAVVGSRTPGGREEYRRYFEASSKVPGPVTGQLGDIARRHGVHLVVGVIERGGATLYCSILFFDQHGNLLGKRRKLMPVAAERLIFGFGDAATLDVYDTPVGRIGAIMCWENLMPAARMAMYDQGVQLYLAPNAVGTDIDHATARHIAREGRCFVIASHLVMGLEDFPHDYGPAQGGTAQFAISRGGSSIVGPMGNVLAGPTYDEESLLVADLDLDDIVRGKYDFDVTGHYARPDLFQLHVDRRPRDAVTYGEPVASTVTEPPRFR